jgi:hypothetical protein
MKLSLLVPFRDDGTRGEITAWMLARWHARLPGAEIIVASDDGHDPFCKAMAVNRAAAQATGDVLGILDSDIWLRTKHMEEAVRAVASGKVPWLIPAKEVIRLTPAFTQRVLAMDPAADFPPVLPEDIERRSRAVGLLHLFPRAGFDRVGGMDERYRGWGGEDCAWTAALDTLWGKHATGGHTLLHLWHPRARGVSGKPIWIGQTGRNTDLNRSYRRARGNPRVMAALCAEARAARHA